MIPGFIRSLANTFTYQPNMDLQQVNDRMQQTGWGDFELDYFTFRLAVECLEAYGLEKSEYKSAQWFVKSKGHPKDLKFVHERPDTSQKVENFILTHPLAGVDSWQVQPLFPT